MKVVEIQEFDPRDHVEVRVQHVDGTLFTDSRYPVHIMGQSTSTVTDPMAKSLA